MYRIRFHGRGGQGIKTASRILGTAFFHEGFDVQDAPRYGAERRGAPIFAYVRAARRPIHERGIIHRPDLVVVADDSLVSVPAAGVVPGIDAHAVLLINSHDGADIWAKRLNLAGTILVLPAPEEIRDRAEMPYAGATCAGAAARLVGVISWDSLAQAIEEEVSPFGATAVEHNLERARAAFDAMAEHAGRVRERDEVDVSATAAPAWIELPFDAAAVSAPTIHAAATSVQVKTGLWRTMRPVVDYERCHRCWWVCSTFCPDGAINVGADGTPQIDYDHCKGCLVCVAVCPHHAIEAIPEHQAQAEEAGA